MRRKLLTGGAVLLAVVVALAAGAYFDRPSPGDPVQIEVASGATTSQVAAQLETSDVISSALFFRLMARVRGLEGELQAGRYEMAEGMGVQAALDVLSKAPIEKGVTVPIPEGFSLRQIAERLEARTQIVGADFIAAANSGAGRASIQPPEVNLLEGLLFPESYFVGERENAEGVVRRMVEHFEQRTVSLDWSLPESRGLSRYQAVIIASLIEREARVAEDRPKVAAVIYNRLARGMRLQIDITALYGLDEHKVPTRADLQRPSPYNTYLIDGLPPTPIASPGLDSLSAALHPANGDWIYYVVIDPSGRHGFTNSPEEFARLKQQRPEEVH